MGDPRRLKKKFKVPKKMWDRERIIKETELKKKYGLKNTREIWKAATKLRKVRTVARESLSLPEEKKMRNQKLIVRKLSRLGIIAETSNLDDVLSLTTDSFLERRLQTLVYKKGLARSILQARQLIVHGFIEVAGKRITAPGYLVKKYEEDSIRFFKQYKMPEGPKPQEPVSSTKEVANQDQVSTYEVSTSQAQDEKELEVAA